MGFKMKPKSPLTMKLASGVSPAKFEIVVDKHVPKERSKPLVPNRPVMPVMPVMPVKLKKNCKG